MIMRKCFVHTGFWMWPITILRDVKQFNKDRMFWIGRGVESPSTTKKKKSFSFEEFVILWRVQKIRVPPLPLLTFSCAANKFGNNRNPNDWKTKRCVRGCEQTRENSPRKEKEKRRFAALVYYIACTKNCSGDMVSFV